MPEEIITRDSAAFKELYRDIVKAIRAVDILIDTHRPTIGNELYLTSEEICSIFINAPARGTARRLRHRHCAQTQPEND